MHNKRVPYHFLTIIVVLFLVQVACFTGGGQNADPFADDPVQSGTLESGSAGRPTVTPAPADSIPETAPTQAAAPAATQPSPAEPSPTSTEEQGIPGLWHGTAQWLCGDNPVWWTTLEFEANGTVHATLSTATDTVNADAPWTLSGDQISLHFENDLWTGTVMGDSMEGTFGEEDCSGVWSVTKE